jgi:hypothetical protein
MGFDLYGLNPQHNEDEPLQLTKLKSQFENEDGWMQYDEMTDKQKKQYFELVDKLEASNPGRYFRNNVWFWRPLWSFVCHYCADFLSVNDADAGAYNDARRISKTKAVKIGKRLSKLLADGTVDKEVREYELAKAKADITNKEVEEKLEELKETVKKETGKDDLAPAKYPEPYKTQWDEIYGSKSWDSEYPFHKENIENFAKFCLQSGGFEIC